AAEKRRRRKRGLMEDPPRRVFINDAVCEGCGDCSVQSNCVSVQPLQTVFGRKRRIDQSNCNKDFSCVKGFCPSFVSVHGGTLRKARGAGVSEDAAKAAIADLPEPVLPGCVEPYGIMITGIGGTGVITIGALLGMAAHIEGLGVTVLDQTGLAQKNGAVGSHVRIAATPEDLHATRIAAGGARLLLGCDIVTAATPEVLSMLEPGRSRAVVNGHVTPPAAFVIDNTIDLGSRLMTRHISEATGKDCADFIDATRLATALLGDSIASNLFMVGYAWQKGLVPLRRESLEAAIRLNGVAVDFNLRAFNWGRLAEHDRARIEALAAEGTEQTPQSQPDMSLDELIEHRAGYLVDYQNAAYANRYREFVTRVRDAEAKAVPGQTALSESVARNLCKLMAYKDEYEVARLYSCPEFKQGLERQFEGDFRLGVHLAPPLFARRDPDSGRLIKREYGPWVFRLFAVLARLRWLRGGWLDPFGRSAERVMERQLIDDYRRNVTSLLEGLGEHNHQQAVAIAELPDQIRGFGHVKQRNVQSVREREQRLLAAYGQNGSGHDTQSPSRTATG
ncbi:MAG: 2-oxoacid:acceptor oxidoreductase family protein, partial [Gammaproteobacteria bacterium]|nr:2-oxoacid:acceptor oxidoreductase family protein [Gammaproteobacteria bacterium]